MNDVLWSPTTDLIEQSEMSKFQKHIEDKYSLKFNNYKELHKWSNTNSSEFWTEIIQHFNIVHEGNLEPACTGHSFNEYGWFPNVKLNFCENLLNNSNSSKIAINFQHESGNNHKLSYQELTDQTSKLQHYLKSILSKGDILACYMPNIPETVVSMLATTSFGGVFTSTSCDFGIEGIVDRFGQARPKVLVAACGYEYNGKYFDLTDKIKEISERLTFIEKIILVDFLNKKPDIKNLEKGILWSDIMDSDSQEIIYERVSFADPLYIMYSSGTTGKPKCMVHSVGGTLLQHVKELALHTNHTASKKIFYFTTCGWMMWNWLVSSLYMGGETILFEGSPGYPTLNDFFNIIKREEINIFGTSPKFLKALEDTNSDEIFDFPSLETLLSTGAPLLPEQFDFIYSKIKKDIQVASICGGTDIIGCFMLGNPNAEVRRGEIQCLALGMDVDCVDNNGESVRGGEGELVCRSSFPSRPIKFLNDPNNEKMKNSYFNKFENIWHHGDFITITEDETVIVFGRSDATLNPGGVRIGTSEIYRQTESLAYLVDSICVGKQVDGDVEVLLFVKMIEGQSLSVDQINEMKKLIRKGTTPRHVPKQIYQVSDIPYTRSGKKMELAITRLVNNKELTNIEAVSNPECLEQYKII
jgi:acetoacetyl-CoA synthetase